VSHPTLGHPPRSLTSGYPDSAARLREHRTTIAARALEVAVDADRSFEARYDEAGLRNLLADGAVLVDRLALCVAGDDPFWLREFADQTATVYRRRGVPMDDVVQLCEGLRVASRSRLEPGAIEAADRALDAAIEIYRWYRRLGGDARRRNKILAKLYRGVQEPR
jgi:hypothetical protein